MEELCTAAGGYGRFFRTLVLQYLGWWVGIVVVPAVFLDHHRCEARLPWFAWLLYSAVVVAMLVLAVLLELSVVQRLGLLQAGEIFSIFSDYRWQLPLLSTVLWKLDTYTDVVFIFVARDCGSSLWWASLATFVFAVIFGQLLLNMCFACTDCDRELPASFGFILLDFKLVNTAVRQVLTFDPDVSHLPVARPVTLRSSGHLVGMEKIICDVAQVTIQVLFLSTVNYAHGLVLFSVLVGVLHGTLSLSMVCREFVQDEVALQGQGLQQGTALQPVAAAAAAAERHPLQPGAPAAEARQPAPSGGSGGPAGASSGGPRGPARGAAPSVVGRPAASLEGQAPAGASAPGARRAQQAGPDLLA